MNNKNLNIIYKEYLTSYKKEGIIIKPSKLQYKITESANEAVINYRKLKEPRTCPIETYIDLWVRQSIGYDLAKKSVKTVNLEKPPAEYKATVNFYLLYSNELLIKSKRELFDARPQERIEVWDSFDLPYQKIEERLKKVIKERNLLAKAKGFSNKIDMSLDWYSISTSDYKSFIKNVDKTILFCSNKLSHFTSLPEWFYSEFNRPCYLCQIPSIPFTSLDDVLNFVIKQYKMLDDFKHKIKIKLDRRSKMIYEKQTDSFKITIDEKGNIRHKLMDLLHELGHVVNYLMDFKVGINPYTKGIYKREKEAIKIEYALLKKLSPEIYKARFGDALLNFWEILFLVELHSNPDQNLSKLCASIFNKCFKNANQKYNPTYIVNENIMLQPFYTLPHAVSHSELILELISEKTSQ